MDSAVGGLLIRNLITNLSFLGLYLWQISTKIDYAEKANTTIPTVLKRIAYGLGVHAIVRGVLLLLSEPLKTLSIFTAKRVSLESLAEFGLFQVLSTYLLDAPASFRIQGSLVDVDAIFFFYRVYSSILTFCGYLVGYWGLMRYWAAKFDTLGSEECIGAVKNVESSAYSAGYAYALQWAYIVDGVYSGAKQRIFYLACTYPEIPAFFVILLAPVNYLLRTRQGVHAIIPLLMLALAFVHYNLEYEACTSSPY